MFYFYQFIGGNKLISIFIMIGRGSFYKLAHWNIFSINHQSFSFFTGMAFSFWTYISTLYIPKKLFFL